MYVFTLFVYNYILSTMKGGPMLLGIAVLFVGSCDKGSCDGRVGGDV